MIDSGSWARENLPHKLSYAKLPCLTNHHQIFIRLTKRHELSHKLSHELSFAGAVTEHLHFE